ncbi:MAG: flavin reductase family protein [Clostridia bacterium]|nr:flavin reductase family protein [Clostridia bacterium]
MSKSVWRGSTLLSPVPPALVACGTLDSPNVFTVAWTGIINSQPPKTYISVRPERYSHGLILESGEFTINLPTKNLVRTVDFCGVRSGRDMNKFEKCGITAAAASEVSAPIVEEAPISLECRVFERKSFGTHDMFLADIVAVDADDAYIDKDGKLDLSKAGLIAYAHGEYYALGENLGKFGFSVRRRKHARK